MKEGDAWFSAVDPDSLLRQSVHIRAAAPRRSPSDPRPVAFWLAVTLIHLLVSLWWGVAGRARTPIGSGRLERELFEATLFAIGTLHGVLFVGSLVTGLQAGRGVWWIAAWDVAVFVGLAIEATRSRAWRREETTSTAAAMPASARVRLALSACGAIVLLGLAIAWMEISARSLIVTGSDAAHYHAPHAVRFALGGSPFDLLATPHVYPMGTSLIAAWFLLPLGNPLLIDVPMLLAFALLTASLLRLFRLVTGQPGLLWVPWFVLALAAAPLMQSATLLSSDLPFAAGFMAASAQLVAWWIQPRVTTPRDAVLLGLSFGLLCGVKTTGAAALALLVSASAGVWLFERYAAPREATPPPAANARAVARRAGLVGVALVAWLAGGGLWLVRNEVRYGSPIAPSGLQIAGVTIFEGESFSSASAYYSVAEDVRASGYRLTRSASHHIRRWLGPVLWPTAALLLALMVDGVALRRRWRSAPAGFLALTPDQRLVMLAAFLLLSAALVWLLTRAPWTSLEWTDGLSLRYALPVIVGVAFCAFLGLFPHSWRWYESLPLTLVGWLLIAGGGLGLFVRSRAALPAASLVPVPRIEPIALVVAAALLALGWAARSRAVRAAALVAAAVGVWPLSASLAARSARFVADVQYEEARRVTCAAAGIDLGLDDHAAFYAELLAQERRRGASCPTRRMFVNARFDAPLSLQSLPYVALVADLHSGELDDTALREAGRSPCDYLVVTRAELDTQRGSTLVRRASAMRPWTVVAERAGYVAFAVVDR